LQSAPYPYLQEHADSWVEKNKAICDAAIRELEEEDRTNPDGPLKILDLCPVRSIREVRANGTDKYLGDIAIGRCTNDEMNDDSKDPEIDLTVLNLAKETGDPTIVWTVGGTQQPERVQTLYLPD
jgi:hypothetical protein